MRVRDASDTQRHADACRPPGGGLALWELLAIVALMLIVAVVIFPLFARQRNGGPSVCLSNVKQISMALIMYSTDYDEWYPPHRDWVDRVYPYIRNRDIFICPRARGLFPSYGYNPAVGGKHFEDIQNWAETVLIYESTEDGKLVERHDGGANYGLGDGHAKWFGDPPAGFLDALGVDPDHQPR